MDVKYYEFIETGGKNIGYQKHEEIMLGSIKNIKISINDLFIDIGDQNDIIFKNGDILLYETRLAIIIEEVIL